MTTVREWIENNKSDYIALQTKNYKGQKVYYLAENPMKQFEGWLEEEIVNVETFEEDEEKFTLLIIK